MSDNVLTRLSDLPLVDVLECRRSTLYKLIYLPTLQTRLSCLMSLQQTDLLAYSLQTHLLAFLMSLSWLDSATTLSLTFSNTDIVAHIPG